MEIKLTKTQRLIVHGARKDNASPVLQCVHFKPGMIEAADGYMMVQCKVEGIETEMLLDAKSITKLKDSKGLGGVMVVEGNKDNEVKVLDGDVTLLEKQPGEFPQLERLYPTTKPVLEIGFSKELLSKMLACLEKDAVIRFKFYGTEKPAEFAVKEDCIRGLIMPMILGEI